MLLIQRIVCKISRNFEQDRIQQELFGALTLLRLRFEQNGATRIVTSGEVSLRPLTTGSE